MQIYLPRTNRLVNLSSLENRKRVGGEGGGSWINRSLGNDGSSKSCSIIFPFSSVKWMEKNKNRRGSFLFSTLSSPIVYNGEEEKTDERIEWIKRSIIESILARGPGLNDSRDLPRRIDFSTFFFFFPYVSIVSFNREGKLIRKWSPYTHCAENDSVSSSHLIPF